MNKNFGLASQLVHGSFIDELFQVMIKDSQFYQSSGGDVTIGGGELTVQPSFTNVFLKKYHDNYLHIAVDRYGEIKYPKLGKPYKLDNLSPPDDAGGEEVKQIFMGHGLNAQLKAEYLREKARMPRALHGDEWLIEDLGAPAPSPIWLFLWKKPRPLVGVLH